MSDPECVSIEKIIEIEDVKCPSQHVDNIKTDSVNSAEKAMNSVTMNAATSDDSEYEALEEGNGDSSKSSRSRQGSFSDQLSDGIGLRDEREDCHDQEVTMNAATSDDSEYEALEEGNGDSSKSSRSRQGSFSDQLSDGIGLRDEREDCHDQEVTMNAATSDDSEYEALEEGNGDSSKSSRSRQGSFSDQLSDGIGLRDEREDCHDQEATMNAATSDDSEYEALEEGNGDSSKISRSRQGSFSDQLSDGIGLRDEREDCDDQEVTMNAATSDDSEYEALEEGNGDSSKSSRSRQGSFSDQLSDGIGLRDEREDCHDQEATMNAATSDDSEYEALEEGNGDSSKISRSRQGSFSDQLSDGIGLRDEREDCDDQEATMNAAVSEDSDNEAHEEDNGDSSKSSRSRESSFSDQLSDGIGLEDEREDCDSPEENSSLKDKILDGDEDRRNPQFIPKKGFFYQHDDRIMADENEESNDNDPNKREITENGKEDTKNAAVKKGKVWVEKHDRWSHDLYNEEEQKSKTTQELIDIYGYDIRNEEAPPRARRRHRYGPNKYTRNSEDEDVYARSAPQQRRVFHNSRIEFPKLGEKNGGHRSTEKNQGSGSSLQQTQRVFLPKQYQQPHREKERVSRREWVRTREEKPVERVKEKVKPSPVKDILPPAFEKHTETKPQAAPDNLTSKPVILTLERKKEEVGAPKVGRGRGFRNTGKTRPSMEFFASKGRGPLPAAFTREPVTKVPDTHLKHSSSKHPKDTLLQDFSHIYISSSNANNNTSSNLSNIVKETIIPSSERHMDRSTKRYSTQRHKTLSMRQKILFYAQTTPTAAGPWEEKPVEREMEKTKPSPVKDVFPPAFEKHTERKLQAAAVNITSKPTILTLEGKYEEVGAPKVGRGRGFRNTGKPRPSMEFFASKGRGPWPAAFTREPVTKGYVPAPVYNEVAPPPVTSMPVQQLQTFPPPSYSIHQLYMIPSYTKPPTTGYVPAPVYNEVPPPPVTSPPMQLPLGVFLPPGPQPTAPVTFRYPAPPLLNYLPPPSYQPMALRPPEIVPGQFDDFHPSELYQGQQFEEPSHSPADLYQMPGGITYYSTRTQSEVARPNPPPRINLAIPIVPPPDNLHQQGDSSKQHEVQSVVL